MVALVPVDSRLSDAVRATPGPGCELATPWDLRTDGVTGLVRDVVASVTDADGPAPWGTYLAVDPDSRQVVGTCGFRGPPHGRRVEIAFWTFPPFEGRGWATSMARALVARAYEHPRSTASSPTPSPSAIRRRAS